MMKSSIKIITCISILVGGMTLLPTAFAQSISNTKSVSNVQGDSKKLITLWLDYQKHLMDMEQAITSIKNESDDNQRNAKIAFYTSKLEEQKNLLNRLILTQQHANLLRQQMLEHATKYQNVFKLSAHPKPNPNQINMYTRLNSQTDSLFNKMQTTAKSMMH